VNLHLLVDIGNTSLKWAVRASDTLEEMRVVRHHGGLPIDLHAAWDDLAAPEQILVSNVGGEAIGAALAAACLSRWHQPPRFVQTEPSSHGITVAYARPERLGVDRWLAMVAARRLCLAPVLLVDAGTAVTYDLLLADGRQLGGLILPGIEMMRESLLAGTHIPRGGPEDAVAPWATDTAGAVAAGSVQALAALAERLSDRLMAEAHALPELILTGGDADQLLTAIGRPARHEPNLILQGLALLA
jgi:type III pantothenate kinase